MKYFNYKKETFAVSFFFCNLDFDRIKFRLEINFNALIIEI